MITTTCPPHRYVVVETHVRYELPKAKGAMLEWARMICKLCYEVKEQEVVIPPEYAGIGYRRQA